MTFETQAGAADRWLRALALAAIRAYQRHVSPNKGFGCAYRVHTGHASCSVLGYRAVRRFGLGAGWVLLRRRLRLCDEVHRRHHPPPGSGRGLALGPAAQRGFCDAGCDLPCDAGTDGCDACDCADCDWPNRKKKEPRRAERQRSDA